MSSKVDERIYDMEGYWDAVPAFRISEAWKESADLAMMAQATAALDPDGRYGHYAEIYHPSKALYLVTGNSKDEEMLINHRYLVVTERAALSLAEQLVDAEITCLLPPPLK